MLKRSIAKLCNAAGVHFVSTSRVRELVRGFFTLDWR